MLRWLLKAALEYKLEQHRELEVSNATRYLRKLLFRCPVATTRELGDAVHQLQRNVLRSVRATDGSSEAVMGVLHDQRVRYVGLAFPGQLLPAGSKKPAVNDGSAYWQADAPESGGTSVDRGSRGGNSQGGEQPICFRFRDTGNVLLVGVSTGTCVSRMAVATEAAGAVRRPVLRRVACRRLVSLWVPLRCRVPWLSLPLSLAGSVGSRLLVVPCARMALIVNVNPSVLIGIRRPVGVVKVRQVILWRMAGSWTLSLMRLKFLESIFIDQATLNGTRPNSPAGVKPAGAPEVHSMIAASAPALSKSPVTQSVRALRWGPAQTRVVECAPEGEEALACGELIQHDHVGSNQRPRAPSALRGQPPKVFSPFLELEERLLTKRQTSRLYYRYRLKTFSPVWLRMSGDEKRYHVVEHGCSWVARLNRFFASCLHWGLPIKDYMLREWERLTKSDAPVRMQDRTRLPGAAVSSATAQPGSGVAPVAEPAAAAPVPFKQIDQRAIASACDAELAPGVYLVDQNNFNCVDSGCSLEAMTQAPTRIR
jgi:hypothetical protein